MRSVKHSLWGVLYASNKQFRVYFIAFSNQIKFSEKFVTNVELIYKRLLPWYQDNNIFRVLIMGIDEFKKNSFINKLQLRLRMKISLRQKPSNSQKENFVFRFIMCYP